MEKVSRAEKALERLAARTGMTREGLNWLKCAVDPFHDTELDVQGYPDMATGKSIVECIKMSRTITVAGSPKDLLVRLDNVLQRTVMAQKIDVKNGNFIYNPAVSPGTQCGGLSIVAADAGSNLNQDTSPNYSSTASIDPDPRYMRRRSRILASGFEVHNVTPELTKGGSVTVFEQTQSNEQAAHLVFLANGTTPVGSTSYVMNAPYPNSEAEALLLPGSKTWDASAGCYCIQKQQNLENPPTNGEYLGIISQRENVTNVSYDFNFPNVPNVPFNVSAFGLGGIGGGENQMKKLIPHNSVGAYFTGLPVGSIMRINWNLWIERFPSVQDVDLIVLCKPSSSFDPVALEAYARIIDMMPIGVPVKENGLGDWFAGTVAVLIDTLLGGPYVSTALGFVNSIMSSPTNQNNSNPNVETKREVIIERREQQPRKNKQITLNIPKKQLPPLPKTPPKPLPKIPAKK